MWYNKYIVKCHNIYEQYSFKYTDKAFPVVLMIILLNYLIQIYHISEPKLLLYNL